MFKRSPVLSIALISLLGRSDIPMFSPRRPRHQSSDSKLNPMFIGAQYQEAP